MGLSFRRGRRVLFVEFLGADSFHHANAAMYPLAQGRARAAGLETRWIVLDAGPEARPESNYIVELTAEQRGKFLEAVEGFAPTLVILNEKLGPETQQALREAAEATIEVIDGGDRGLLEEVGLFLSAGRVGLDALGQASAPRKQRLFGASELDYQAEVLDPGEYVGLHYTTIHAGHPCLYQRPVTQNEVYSELSLPKWSVHAGCTFCAQSRYSRRPRKRSGPDPVETALLQVRRFLETAPTPQRGRKFLLEGISVFHHLGDFLEGLEALGVEGCEFLFNPRVDEFLAQADRLQAMLPAFARRGNAIRLWSMGVENFSPAENQRFNKGILAEQVFEAHERLEDFESRWPESFLFRQQGRGGFALILFTPWTRPEDLALNVDGMRRTKMGEEGDLLVSRLQLAADTAIARLAKSTGVLADTFTDSDNLALPCKKRWDWADAELPWRFEHLGVSAVYQILLRVEGAGEAGDPLGAAVRAHLARRPSKRRNRLSILDDALQVLARESELDSPSAVLERLDAAE